MDYTALAGRESIEKTIAGLKGRNFDGMSVKTGADALEKIKELIPKGVSVMNGTSQTLEKIGYVEYLKGSSHGWNNLHAAVLAEADQEKQSILRRQSVVSDYYLGSVHAITEEGEMVIASNTGSQLPHLVYTSKNIILVVSTKKITPTLAAAIGRLEQHVLPLEDARIEKAYNVHTVYAKTLVLHRENPSMGRKVLVILVEEDLGF